jgi:tetratricopeptide (TPR) repeat protein
MRPVAALLLLSLCPLRPATHEDLQSLVEDGHWKRARAIVEQRMPAASNDARFLWLASQVFTAFGRFDQAAGFGEKAVRLDPNNAGYHYNLSEVYGSIAEKASLFRQASYGRKCKKAMDEAVRLNPRHIDTLIVQMLFYYQAPGLFGGDKAKARAMPAEISRIDPSQGYLAEARLAVLQKQAAKLEDLYVKAVAANPRSFEARMSLARQCLGRRNCARAEEHALEAARIHPGRVDPHTILAIVSARNGKFAEMETRLAEAEKLFPDDLSPFYSAAVSLQETGRELGKAEAYLRKYLAQKPEPSSAGHARAASQLALLMRTKG